MVTIGTLCLHVRYTILTHSPLGTVQDSVIIDMTYGVDRVSLF